MGALALLLKQVQQLLGISSVRAVIF